jgi:mitochondrial GTPase 1
MMPFVPTAQTFLSLALCGSIRDSIVPPPILADYLLYHLNLHNPELYMSTYAMNHPTNDVFEFLTAVAKQTGKLLRGGYVDEGAAAMDAITRFRKGALGEWAVDRITPDAFELRIKEEVRARLREYKGGMQGSGASPKKGTNSF